MMDKSYGKTLRQIRKDKGLSQEELAFKTNLHRTYISLLERDQKSPSLRTVTTIAAAMGYSLLEFVKKKDEAD